jgi:flagellar biosynthetic protein FliO
MNKTIALTLVLCGAVAGLAFAEDQPTGGEAQPQAPAAIASSDSAANIENQLIVQGPATTSELPKSPLDLTGTAQLIASLTIVIALIVVAVWAFRRFAPRTARMYSSENLRVVSRTFIGPKQMVCLMKAPGRLLVVGATQESITLLSEITDAAEIERVLGSAAAASPKGASAAFRDLLSGTAGLRKKDAVSEEDLAAAVDSISARFANLSQRLGSSRSGSAERRDSSRPDAAQG